MVTTGGTNVAIGNRALINLRHGAQSTAVGYGAGYFATGSENTFVGYNAGYGGTSSAPYSSGERNIAIGRSALVNFTTGDYNTAIGYERI